MKIEPTAVPDCSTRDSKDKRVERFVFGISRIMIAAWSEVDIPWNRKFTT
ncbi:MAG: hypothetical protein JXB06_13595 [Spirochaetales bacterium]|nr:hypothetical protein [Spirochaetales bacterium]